MPGLLFTVKETQFDDVVDLASESHHTIVIGQTEIIGRKTYGRHEFGVFEVDTEQFTLIPVSEDEKIVKISCGE